MSAPQVIFDEPSKTVYIFGDVIVQTPANWNRMNSSALTAPVRVALVLFDSGMATTNQDTSRKMAAIKAIRRLSGCGLREAKDTYDFVERLSTHCVAALCNNFSASAIEESHP